MLAVTTARYSSGFGLVWSVAYRRLSWWGKRDFEISKTSTGFPKFYAKPLRHNESFVNSLCVLALSGLRGFALNQDSDDGLAILTKISCSEGVTISKCDTWR